MASDPPQQTYDLSLLTQSQRKWEESAGLRLVYESIFGEMHSHRVEGPSLELGSGIGNIKECLPEVTTSDIVRTPHVDMACSAYAIPRPGTGTDAGGWANILAIDVLHHLCRPLDFFESAAAALRPGGRIILAEPAATPFGRCFYRLCHHEPIRPREVPPSFAMEADPTTGEFANMGMGVALFRQQQQAFAQALAGINLRIVTVRFRDLLAYPATGGYSRRQLLPTALLRVLLAIESRLPQCLLRLLGLRMLIVLERDR